MAHAAPETPANPLIRAIAGHPWAVLGAVALVTLLALAQLLDWKTGALRIGMDPSLDPLIAIDDSSRDDYERVRRRFGDDEVVLVVLRSADLYAPDALRRLDRLTRKLDELPGVAQVRSLTSVALASRSDGEMSVARVSQDELDDPALPARLRQRVHDNPLVQGQLVSADGTAAAIVVTLETASGLEILERGLAEQVATVADTERAEGVDVWVTGAPIVRAATSRTVVEQLRWMVPATGVLLTVFLALAFRTLRSVLVPLATLALSLIWTFATLSVVGKPLNLITSLVPPLLVTMGLAYCAHVLSEFESLPVTEALRDPRKRVAALLREVAAPVILTGVTTAVGLMAVAFTDLPAIREFAWLSSIGVLFTVVLALTFTPALLGISARGVTGKMPGDALFARVSRSLGQFDIRRRKAILAGACLAFLIAMMFTAHIQVGDHFVGVFKPEARARADFEAVSRVLGGVTPVAIHVDGQVADTFVDPEALRALARLEQWLGQQPEVGSVSGLPDQVKALNALFLDAPPDALPATAAGVKQLLLFGGGDAARGVVNGDASATLIRVRLTVDDTAAITAFLDRLQPQLATLPAHWVVRPTGQSVMLARSVQSVTFGQLQSIGFALLLIYICLALQFTSFKIGLLASLPTLLQTVLYFGALGASGVTLNATTGLVECLVLGLAVDDTIHYLVRFNANAKSSGSESEAAVGALSAVLRPVTLTKMMLALGFLMLTTGELRNQVLFGWLAAFTLVAAWLVDALVTPAFMSGVRVVTLWDSLRLNLGSDPQGTIPLFSGLSTRRARIFALMSDLQTRPAGHRLMSEGDPGGDVYVVIDGELSVWVERDGAKLQLATIGRGAVLGETGYFGQKRTANVDAVTPVRLLRFDDAVRERICRRYPAIAARVFLNLNRIQAERFANQMRHMH